MLIDTHAHLNFNAFAEDWRTVAQSCVDAHMKVVNVGTQLPTSEKAMEIAAAYPGSMFAAAGFHPTHIVDTEFDPAPFRKLAKSGRLVAIGECGLDHYRLTSENPADEEQQKAKQTEVFRAQIAIARQTNLPLIIHCRDAYDEVIAMLESEPGVRGVIHCFVGSREVARQFLDLGFLISFTGIITFSKDAELAAVVAETSLEQMMIETDAPYLSPAPVRGKRNQPENVRYVAEKIAEIKKVSVETIIAQTAANAVELFKLQ